MRHFFKILTSALLAMALLLSAASALTVEQALELLEMDYYFDIPAEAYEAEDLQSLMSILGDTYTYYMDGEAYQNFLASVEDTVDMVGIGVSIQYTADGILVIEPLENSSAQKAGILPGDLIIAVDGTSCVPANESHRPLILGDEGTTVNVTVLRGSERLDFILTRCRVVIPNTEFQVLDNHIGYIDCNSFGSETGELFADGIQTYNESVDHWLVDLRSNSGGYTTAAVTALGTIAGPGAHLYLQAGDDMLYYYAHYEAALTNHPVIVLTDSYSASASEAFTAGIRDWRAGISVGSRTYGKGTAQIIRDSDTHPDYFTDGDALKLTAYRFYSHAGVTNNEIGVIPTLLVPPEMAEAVAIALCGTERESLEDHLFMMLGDHPFAIDLQATSPDVLATVFEALPPGTLIWTFEGDTSVDYTIRDAAQHFGITYNTRWFNDVAGSVFCDPINTLATYDILCGDGSGNFRPEDTMTRAEACAMIVHALGLSGTEKQYFTDVSDDDPYAPYINVMAKMGLVCGMGDGTFQPDKQMTQQEYYTLLARALCYLNVNYSYAMQSISQEALDKVTDMGFHSWAVASTALIDMADGLCFTSGQAGPNTAILREEAAATLYAVLVAAGVL